MSLQFNMVHLCIVTKQWRISFTYIKMTKHLLLLHLFTLYKDVLEGWLYYNEGLNNGQWLPCK